MSVDPLRVDGTVTSPDPTEPIPDEAVVPPRPRRRVGRRVRRGVVVVGLLLTAAVLLVVQTGRGHEIVLRAAIDRVRDNLAGELQVDGIRSGTLLRGATLTGVSLDAEGGRSFLTADSVVLRYSLTSSIAGGGTIRSAVFWGLDLEIARRSNDEPVNVAQLLVPGPPDTTGSADTPLQLGRIGIRNGRVRILTPAAPGSRGPTVTTDDGVVLRQLTLDSLDLDVEDAVLVPSSAVQFEARLASFSADISIVDEPLVVREAFGDVTFGVQGLRFVDAAFRLPGSLLRGDVAVGPRTPGDPWTFRSELELDGWGDLADLMWIDERIPPGRARGGANVTVEDGIVVDLDDFEVELEASRMVTNGRVTFAEEMSMRSVVVTANPIVLERIEPWIGQEFPLDGWLSGQATFSGTLDDLSASGRVTLVPTGLAGGVTTADFTGVLHRGDDPGVSKLEARLDPLNYTVLEAFWPQFHPDGTGSARIELDGRVADGMNVVADLQHEDSTSWVVARGTLRRGEDGRWYTDMSSDLMPLSVSILAPLQPDLGLRGSVTGTLSFRGPLDSLSVEAELAAGEGAEGTVGVEASVDLTDPSIGYALDVAADGLQLSSLIASLPERSVWTGEFEIEGDGFQPDSMSAVARMSVEEGRVGAIRVEDGAAEVRIDRGVLITDSVRATVAGIDISGRGRLGLADGRFGSSRFEFDGPSLVGLRPLLMGVADSVMVQDRLTNLSREFLRLGGIEPDTLPFESDVRMSGAVSGSAIVSGEINNLDVGITARVVDGRYQQNGVDTANVALTGTGLPGSLGDWEIGASAFGIAWNGLQFDQGDFDLDLFERSGTGRVALLRGPDESYAVEGSVRLDSIGGEIGLTEASVQIGEQRWDLVRPSRVAWDGTTLEVDSLAIERIDDDPMTLAVDGTLASGGESDFHVVLDGLHFEQVAHVAQRNELAIGGHIELDVSVHGPAEAPEISGDFRVDGPRYGAMELSRLEGRIEYADRLATFEVEGWDGQRAAVRASGDMPMNLGFVGVEDRIPDAPLDVSISADSLDAAIALSYLTTLEQVLGVVSGDVHIAGTTGEPEPDGLLTLRDGEWSIQAIGVRHSGVTGDLRLLPDRTVEVAMATAGVGTSEVHGVVLLNPLRDPALDLTFSFDRFPAVVRPDIEGLVSGEFVLNGTYRRPLAQGDLTVDESTVYVDELRRAADVVDLRDPFLFRTGITVDTTALITQPLISGLRNPFFDNLRVNVNLSVPSDTWLRSIETNVEIGGDLLVRYDRPAGDFVLIGELQALRGSHLVLGRNFEIDGGTVGFIGRPGMNPTLDIQASSRIRRFEEQPLDILATVEGTLVAPLVTLSTEEAGLGQADLVSYLVFGQSSSEVGGSRGQALGDFGAASSAYAAAQGVVSYVGGRLVNQLGSTVGRGLGLDYVSIETGGRGSLESDYTDAQIEFGRYVSDDVFAVIVWRPTAGEAQEQNNLAGVRVEWAFTDDYNFEAFWEDRFLRSGSSLGTAGLQGEERIWGVFFFREWGY